jgi:hypothetical protein
MKPRQPGNRQGANSDRYILEDEMREDGSTVSSLLIRKGFFLPAAGDRMPRRSE